MNYGYAGVQLNTPLDFWQKVEINSPNDCWPWKQGLWSNGYGRFKYQYKSWRAHRFALVSLDILPEKGEHTIVRHLCNNKICCNPKHLSWGTSQENRWDYLKDFYSYLYQELNLVVFNEVPA